MGVYSGNDVDAAGSAEVTLYTAAGTELLGQQTLAASIPVAIASNQTSIPVSGTITANIGTTNGLALDTTLAKLTITQGTALGTNTGALAFGSVSTGAPSYSNGQLNALSLTVNGGLRVDGSSVTQPVSGTVTANAGTNLNTSLLLLDTTFTGRINTQGQKTMSASTPIVIASDQTTLPVAFSLPTTTGYSAAVGPFSPGALPTDMFTITGSATKTVKVLCIEFTAVQTTRSLLNIFMVKRSAANTGGTSTTSTDVPLDSNNAAGTATIRAYTANPSALGASVGTVSVIKVLSDDSGANAVGGAGYTWDFTKGGTTQGLVLRGTAQTLACNLNGVTLPIGLVIAATITWTEE